MFNRSLGRAAFSALVTPARAYAVTRILIGAWLLVDPDGLFGAKWLGDAQDPVLTGSNIRASGGTDLAIGVGLLVTDRPRPWLWLCAVCNFLDAFAVFLARSRFARGDVVGSMIGAISYGLVAVAVAEFGAYRGRRAGPELA